MQKINRSLLIATFALIFLSSCSPAAAVIPLTETPLPVDTAVPPTSTPVPPTNTPLPTNTPIPPTAIPVPDKANEYLNGVEITALDMLDKPQNGKWGLDAGTIKDGGLEVLGKNWNGLKRESTFKDNQGIMVDFKFSPGSVFEVFYDTGAFFTDPYKRFGVYFDNNVARVNVWAGKKPLGGARLSGNFKLVPDTTYTLLMVLLPDGGFMAVIWDPADTTKAIYYHEKVGANWAGITWDFRIGADKGTIIFDNFKEFTFESIKE